MTPAIDLLAKHGVLFKTHSYQHDPKAESYGDEAAQALGFDSQRIFKTLVVEAKLASGNTSLVVGIVPVSGNLNLKAIAKSVGAKKAVMADKSKVLASTGYVLGGVSPLGQKRALPTVIDCSANDFKTIYVSAGKRGLDVELSANDLALLSKATFADIAAK